MKQLYAISVAVAGLALTVASASDFGGRQEFCAGRWPVTGPVY